MSTSKAEDTQPEPAVPSTAQDETVKTAEDTPATKVEEGDVKTAPKNIKENGTAKNEKNGYRTYEDGMLKTSAQEDPKDRKKNNKYDPSVLPETDDPKLIRKQVEFYFGDSNLPQDTYLWDTIGGTNNMPIKIEALCKFGRMKRFRPITAVVAALRESEFLEVTGPEGLEEVKRKYAFDPTTPRSKTESRSIYAKGFGDEEPSSQFDIEAFFAPYGPTRSVRLRRTPEKLFKGSVFVEFQDDETAKKFLELDPKPLWRGKHTLKLMSKTQYCDEKVEEINDGKIEPGESWARGRGRGRGRGGRGGNHGQRNDRNQRRDRGDRDPDDWKKRREDDRANGFRDDRNRRDNKGRRGRGRRDEKGHRNNDRNHEREEKNGDNSKEEIENDKKRSREDDDEQGSLAKKVDSKPEPVADAGSENNEKRVPENDEAEAKPVKKVDSKSEITTES